MNKYRDEVARAYKVAGEAIRVFDTESECVMRDALAAGRLELLALPRSLWVSIMDGIRYILFTVFFSGALPFLMVAVICRYSNLNWLTTFCISSAAGAFVGVLVVFKSPWLGSDAQAEKWEVERTNREIELKNAFIVACVPLKDEDREALFLFLRHQGVMEMKQKQVYAAGHDEGYRDGYHDGYQDGERRGT